MTNPPRLHVVETTPEPETLATAVRRRIKAMPKPADMVQCRRCGGREFIQSRTGIMNRNGKPTGGTPSLICVLCLSQGERVAVL